MSCLECELPERAVLHGEGGFVVHPVVGGGAVPGWLVIAPRRHVESLEALSEAELAALGPLVARVSSALREATPCAKLYVASFGEVVPHLHVHVIARPPGLDPSLRGPRLFAAEARAPAAEVQAIARAVARSLGPRP